MFLILIFVLASILCLAIVVGDLTTFKISSVTFVLAFLGGLFAFIAAQLWHRLP